MTILESIMGEIHSAVGTVGLPIYWGMPEFPDSVPAKIVLTFETSTSIGSTTAENSVQCSLQAQLDSNLSGTTLAHARARAVQLRNLETALVNWMRTTDLPIIPAQVQSTTGQLEAIGAFGAVCVAAFSWLESA